MKTVKFNCEFYNGEARVSARVGRLEDYEYFPCEDEATYTNSIEHLDAREEMLTRLHATVEEMRDAIRHADKELWIERAERDDDE